jgi:hypothetical protein
MPAKPILNPLAPVPALRHRVLPAVTPVPDESVPATRALAKAARAKPAAGKPAAGSREEEALRITREIKRTLKDLVLGHIHVGRLLARMRDETLYTALGYQTLEQYAKDRFGFESSTLYKHIKAYEWVRANRPDWLTANPKGMIPDYNDIKDLAWINEQLQKPKLANATRADLETLKTKAFEGKLRQKDLEAYKRAGNTRKEGRKAVISAARALRKRCAALADMPAEVLTHLDAVIALLKTA